MDKGKRAAVIASAAVVVVAGGVSAIAHNRNNATEQQRAEALQSAVAVDAENATSEFDLADAAGRCQDLFEATPDGLALGNPNYSEPLSTKVSADLHTVSGEASGEGRTAVYTCTASRSGDSWVVELS